MISSISHAKNNQLSLIELMHSNPMFSRIVSSLHWQRYFGGYKSEEDSQASIFLSHGAQENLINNPQNLVALCRSEAPIKTTGMTSGKNLIINGLSLILTTTPEEIIVETTDETNIQGKSSLEIEVVADERDIAMVDILLSYNLTIEGLLKKDGFTVKDGIVSNQRISYPRAQLNYFKSSDPFDAYLLLRKLDQSFHLEEYTGYEPGAGLGQISAIMALFCKNVSMVEINKQLFRFAQELYERLPMSVRSKVDLYNGDIEDSELMRQIYSQGKLFVYDYFWRLNCESLKMPEGSLLAVIKHLAPPWVDSHKKCEPILHEGTARVWEL